VHSQRAPRFPELDRSKGFAILLVVCIHAKVFEGFLFDEYAVNRAVPIFLVLFGATSELWWRTHTLGGLRLQLALWYRKRLLRLLPPVWAATAVWWLVAWLTLAIPWSESLGAFLSSFVGYCPGMGTSWFVFLILQLILLFPLIHYAASKSLILVVAAAGVVSTVSVWHTWDTIAVGLRLLGDRVPGGGFYYQWIFAPRTFWHVAVGIALARWLGRIGRLVVVTCIALVMAEPTLVAFVRTASDAVFVGPLRQEIAMLFFDVPLAIGLLGIFQWAQLPKPVGRFLEWAGGASWGIYVGHALVHEIVHVLGYEPEAASRMYRGATLRCCWPVA
jgi:surface polysaccharide O-acyltransferase-like enzyme